MDNDEWPCLLREWLRTRERKPRGRKPVKGIDRLCDGLDMRICESCYRHVDRHQDDARLPHARIIRPAANPPRCFDWLAEPASADSVEDKL